MIRMLLFLIKVGVVKGPTLEVCTELELNFVFHQKVEVKVRVLFLSKVGS